MADVSIGYIVTCLDVCTYITASMSQLAITRIMTNQDLVLVRFAFQFDTYRYIYEKIAGSATTSAWLQSASLLLVVRHQWVTLTLTL